VLALAETENRQDEDRLESLKSTDLDKMVDSLDALHMSMVVDNRGKQEVGELEQGMAGGTKVS
jgi:hypothetical protein